MSDVVDRSTSCDAYLAVDGQFIVVGEVALQQHHILPDVTVAKLAARLHVYSVDGRAAVPEGSTDYAGRHEDLLAVRGQLDLRRQDQAFFGRLDSRRVL
jgi:hypothetical protein